MRNREGEWFEIALGASYAWVRVQEPSRYLPVEQLLGDSLAYLIADGPLQLLGSPGEGRSVWSSDGELPRNLPIEVLGFSKVSGRLWVHVRVLDVNPCTEESTGLSSVAGRCPFMRGQGGRRFGSTPEDASHIPAHLGNLPVDDGVGDEVIGRCVVNAPYGCSLGEIFSSRQRWTEVGCVSEA